MTLDSYFKDRECHCLVKPLNDENQVKEIAQVPVKKMKPLFTYEYSQSSLNNPSKNWNKYIEGKDMWSFEAKDSERKDIDRIHVDELDL